MVAKVIAAAAKDADFVLAVLGILVGRRHRATRRA